MWNSSSLVPVQQYSEHLAAVKAIAWSPHQHGLLASGGGTADRCLRFWNTLTGQALQSTDTGSQVCNLAWSKHANELVREHTRWLGSVPCIRLLSSELLIVTHCCLAGQHTWLLPEPDPGVEISITHTGGQADRTFLPCALLGKQ